MKRQTKITIETERHLIISRSHQAVVSRCDQCREEARMLMPEVAARVVDVSVRTIYRWAESGRIHFTETPNGSLLICLTSLIHERQVES
jgi:hypothetical protein